MYIDAIYDRKRDEIQVVERIDGKRVFKTLEPEHVFYYEHPAGSYRTIFGDTCKKFVSNDAKKFKREILRVSDPKIGKPKRIFESDINPVFRSLETHYTAAETPTLQIAYFDIEVEFAPEVGYAPTTDPFNAINAISVYCGWLDSLITLALKPPTLTIEQAETLAAPFENTIVFEDERDLLRAFLDVVEDADILTGWNSEGFDIPYTVNRIERILGKDAARDLCLFGQAPREREYMKFKKLQKTYDLVGRVHLDYLLLYQKHNPQQLHSYKLDYVGEIETGENKVPYEGTLDKLWREDFDKFIEYNRQDTLLLYKIDKEKKFIELANQVAHANCVLLKTTTGSVALVEQAIINDMHMQGVIVPDRKRTTYDRQYGPGAYDRMREEMRRTTRTAKAALSVDDDPDGDDVPIADDENEDDGRTPVVGAYVAKPRVGLTSHVGAIDIMSLYPSALRALNMSPETIRGQCRSDETMALIAERVAKLPRNKRAEAWEGLFHTLEYGHILDRDGEHIIIDWEDGRSETRTGREWHDHIFDPANNLCITANGTIFDTSKPGMIPELLARWYAERKILQGREKWYGAVGKGLLLKDGETWDGAVKDGLKLAGDFSARLIVALAEIIDRKLDDRFNLKDIVAAAKSDDAQSLASLMGRWGLVFDDGMIVAENREEALFLKGLNNQRQQAKKILLNSLYGALLNEGLRFHDERVGQSVTLTGRSISRHMNSKTNEIISGEYALEGTALIYADTDSCYFSAYEALKDSPDFADFDWSRENIVEFYDAIADEVNASFPPFMQEAFNCSLDRGAIIAAGRELVASRALFIKKKKYACLMYDKENERLDVNGKPGKLKAMGLDLKRADTPKIMQKHLENVLMDILTDKPWDEVYASTRVFREEFKSLDSWKKGTPKAVKALSIYSDQVTKIDRESKDLTRKSLARSKKDKGKVNMPEQVSASLNWNRMLDLNNDRHSGRIADGAKIIVCKLKGNVLGMRSIAYPIDEPHLPQWFKDMPFDDTLMEEKIIDMKLKNLVGVLDWDMTATKAPGALELFTWG